MFLQKYLKKFTEIFSRENFELILINNFRDIIIIISAVGIIIIILVFIFSGFCRKKNNYFMDNDNAMNNNNNKQIIIENDYKFITAEDFIMPEIKSFDLSSEYNEFLPNKKYQLPDIEIVDKINDKLINEAVDESYKFNFEKQNIPVNNK